MRKLINYLIDNSISGITPIYLGHYFEWDGKAGHPKHPFYLRADAPLVPMDSGTFDFDAVGEAEEYA